MKVIELTLKKPIELSNSDQLIKVYNEEDKKRALIGTLKISKGSIDWWPNGKSVKAHKYTWEAFAKLMEEKPATRVKKKAAVKKFAGKKVASKVANAKPAATKVATKKVARKRAE